MPSNQQFFELVARVQELEKALAEVTGDASEGESLLSQMRKALSELQARHEAVAQRMRNLELAQAGASRQPKRRT